VKKRVGCIAFIAVGLAWLGFVSFDLFAATLGDCASPNDACSFYRGYVEGFIIWRGIAVALILILAYAAWRYVSPEDDDVQ
jgi:hypothetical protein